MRLKTAAEMFVIAIEPKESLQSQEASVEVTNINEDINEVLSKIAEYSNSYEDVLSYTSSWLPGKGFQIQRPPSRKALWTLRRPKTAPKPLFKNCRFVAKNEFLYQL